ncbi:MAG: branched-chain amino acid ABC transporter permease [Bacillota bacterium]
MRKQALPLPTPPGSAFLKPKVVLTVLAALIILPAVLPSNTFQNLMVVVMLYAFLGQGWNILGGYAGQVSFGHAVFFGIGAYTSSLLLMNFGVNPWIGMLAGAVLAAVVSAIIGIPALRLSGHFFLMATVGFGEIIRTIFVNLPTVTHGAQGVFLPMLDSSVKNMMFRSSNLGYYYIILGLTIVLFAGTAWLERSKLGYYLRAIKDDPEAAQALGINTSRAKFIALALSAGFTAIGGTFYAQWVLYLDPYSTMPLMTSVQIALVAILGGVGTVWGPLVGAAILLPVNQIIGILLGGGGRGISPLLYGLAIMVIAIWRPNGVMGWLNEREQRRVRFGPSDGAPGKPRGFRSRKGAAPSKGVAKAAQAASKEVSS